MDGQSEKILETQEKEIQKEKRGRKEKYGTFLPGKYLTAIKSRRYINELKRYGLDVSLFES